ncbi:MAG: hypothetical protein ABJC19_10080 [Gemmatimonadota bacterium]
MPSPPSTCISCGKPFAANFELVTLPDASKVVFDPVHRRVWRICGSCNDWNLLGPEAAVAALPELEARIRSFHPEAAKSQGFAPARVSGRLELLRVGSSVNDDTALRLRAEVEKRAKALRYLKSIAGLLFVVWLVTTWPGKDALGVYSLMVFMYAQIALAGLGGRKLRGEEITARALILPILSLVGGGAIAVATSGLETLRYSLFGFLFIAPVVAIGQPFFDRLLMRASLKLPDGTRVSMAEAEMRCVTISWALDASTISIHDVPPGRTQSGSHVPDLYRKICGWASPHITSSAIAKLAELNEEAYRLLNTVGGLPGLLHALEGFRRDQDGRVLLSDLPLVYLVAIDLALTAGSDSGAVGDALRAKALEAGEVAAIAEELSAMSGEQREDG